MSGRPTTSFWRYSQRYEWLVAGAGALLLIVAIAVSLRVLRRHTLHLQQADANRVKHHLQVHLSEAHQQLRRFLQLPPQQWGSQADPLLPNFSDLYELGEEQEVKRVFKAVHGSRVFPGFSFAGSAISPWLRPGGERSDGTTPVSRGLEDEMTSIYVQQRVGDRRLLGRIQLGYIKGFLQRYSAFSGTPTLLVSRDGFVMLSGSESLRIANIDLGRPGAGPAALPPLQLHDRLWLPVVSSDSTLGARVVTLLPDDQLAPIRRVLLAAGASVLVLWGLVFAWKNLRLRRQLFGPVARFADQIRAHELRLRQGQAEGLPAPVAAVEGSETIRFAELAGLQSSFRALTEAIAKRDCSLLEARVREQRSEERQRQLLQSKLRSSLMAAGIAHEINLPLSTIRLLCQQAHEQLERRDTPLDVETLVSSLSLQSQQVSAVIEKMRMLLRTVETEHHPIDLLAVLLGARRAVKPLLREHRVALECHGMDSGPAELQGDAVQLQMALTNLLRNAIEAAQECPDGPRRVRLSLGRLCGALEVDVADSGPGFRFDPADDTLLQSSKPNGSGLGLFVVRTTLAHHRGRISFGRCAELGGARVRLHLPVAGRG